VPSPKIPRLTELQKQDPYYHRMDIVKLAEMHDGELTKGQLRKHKHRRYSQPADAESALQVMVDEGFGEWEFISKSERWLRMRQTYRKDAGPAHRKFVLRKGLTYVRGSDILDASKLDWHQVQRRMLKYIEDSGLTIGEFSGKTQVSESVLKELYKRPRSQTPQWLFRICDQFNISRNWLFNGIGSPSHTDPGWFLPTSPLLERGAGIRKSDDTGDADEGFFTDDRLEFVRAIESWKTSQKKSFPRWTEVFDIFMALGYRKSANPTISAKTLEDDPMHCLNAV